MPVARALVVASVASLALGCPAPAGTEGGAAANGVTTAQATPQAQADPDAGLAGAQGSQAATGDFAPDAKPAAKPDAKPDAEPDAEPDAKPDTQVKVIDADMRASSKEFGLATNDFAFRMYGKLKPKTNQVVSPASIELALGMTAMGAKGETRAEMLSVMGFDPGLDTEQLGARSAAGLTAWKHAAETSVPRGRKTEPGAPGDVQLNIANRLFGDASYVFVPEFLTATKEHFDAELQPANFRGAFETERTKINAWVGAQTKDKIKDLLPPGALDSLSTLVLVNAIYFYGSWAVPFDDHATADAPFTSASGRKVKVPTMEKTGHFRQGKFEGTQLLELSYSGGKFAMIIALPKSGQKVSALAKGLDAKRWESALGSLTSSRVRVFLPRFHVEPSTSLALKPLLEGLGMPLAFSAGGADFSGMSKPASRDDELYISKVFHKGFIDVREAGTEAAAATAVVMATRGGRPEAPPELHIDRPFMFAIVERDTQAILFLGHVGDPSLTD